VCRRIKANPVTGDVLVIQVSAALISHEDTLRGAANGADFYLAAPFEPNDLVNNVRALLGAH
jgi:DNA-binding response OmpR family regulator